jgi:ankyrin repeat protein
MSTEEIEQMKIQVRGMMETESGKQQMTDAFVRMVYDEDILKAKILLDCGVDINQFSSSNDCTALSTVMHLSSDEMINFLLENKADPNACDEDGKTALFSAVKALKTERISRLITAGAKINHQDNMGTTALFEAVNVGVSDEGGQLDPLKILVAAQGVDLNIMDKQGRSALTFANDMDRKEAAQIIQARMK